MGRLSPNLLHPWVQFMSFLVVSRERRINNRAHSSLFVAFGENQQSEDAHWENSAAMYSYFEINLLQVFFLKKTSSKFLITAGKQTSCRCTLNSNIHRPHRLILAKILLIHASYFSTWPQRYVNFPRRSNVSASCKFIMNEHCESEDEVSIQRERNLEQVRILPLLQLSFATQQCQSDYKNRRKMAQSGSYPKAQDVLKVLNLACVAWLFKALKLRQLDLRRLCWTVMKHLSPIARISKNCHHIASYKKRHVHIN